MADDAAAAGPTAGAAPPAEASITGRLILLGVVGAVLAAGIGTLVALQLAEPDIPSSALAPEPSVAVVPRPGAVDGLAADAGGWDADPGSWEVRLTWDEPGEPVDRYVIIRDGDRIGSSSRPSYVDADVEPEASYRYEIVAVAEGRDSKPARLGVRTEALPLSDARLEGRWILRLSVVRSSVDAGGGSMLVRFDPSCDDGPCDVRWSFPGRGNSGVATRTQAAYGGSGSGALFTRDCHGNPVASTTVTLQVRVTTAHALQGEWRATKITGTLRESVPAVSNCLSASNSWTFRGEAQG